jgi:hypothetical protein
VCVRRAFEREGLYRDGVLNLHGDASVEWREGREKCRIDFRLIFRISQRSIIPIIKPWP